MKIAFYISSLGKGGAERVISNLVNYFSNDSNYEVYLILERPTIDYKVNNNVKTFILDSKVKNYNIITKKLRYIKYINKLKKIFKVIKPDIIIPFLAVPAFMALLSKNKDSKVIVAVRNDPKTEYTTILKRKMMLYLYPKADGFVFQTKEAQEYFRNIINCKQTIIYNAISQDFLNYENHSIKQKKIVAVGRLHWQKNYPLLIDAFEVISKKYEDYKLEIYGEGDEKTKLQKLIADKGLIEKVILKGNVNDVKKYIGDAALFVMSSDFEGMPNSLIEAMALGLPVISTDCPCGGPRELINNKKNGILVEVNNKEELIKSIDMILDNNKYANSLGNEAKKIVEKVKPEIINKQWDTFIKDIHQEEKGDKI